MTLGTVYKCQRINWPELKKHEAFVKWFNESTVALSGCATWHRPHHDGGLNTPRKLGEYSDLFTWVERCEGSESDMPEDVWKQLIEAVGEDFVGVVWIDFLGE